MSLISLSEVLVSNRRNVNVIYQGYNEKQTHKTGGCLMQVYFTMKCITRKN